VSRRGARLYHTRGNRDRNERPIIDALEAQGFCVTQLQGRGVPDLLVSKRGIDRVWLVEVKQPDGTYTKAQNEWRTKWTGPPPITLRSPRGRGPIHVAGMRDTAVKPLAIDLFCGLGQFEFCGSADTAVKQLVARRAEHPEHVRLAVLHLAPHTISSMLWTVGQFDDSSLTARLTRSWKIRKLAPNSRYNSGIPVWSSLIVDALDTWVLAVKRTPLFSRCDLGASVRTITTVARRRRYVEMLPAYPAVSARPSDVRLLAAPQPSDASLATERTVTFVRALSCEADPATLAEQIIRSHD
jgi:hypothetical protein